MPTIVDRPRGAPSPARRATSSSQRGAPRRAPEAFSEEERRRVALAGARPRSGGGRSFGGLLANFGSDAVGIATGLPGAAVLLGRSASYPVARAGQGLARGVDRYTPGSAGRGTARALGGYAGRVEDEVARGVTDTAREIARRWGPAVRGTWYQHTLQPERARAEWTEFAEGAYENPLLLGLDAAGLYAVAGQGAALGARAAGRAAPRTRTGQALARIGDRSTLAPGTPLPRGRVATGRRHRPDREIRLESSDAAGASVAVARQRRRPYSSNLITQGLQRGLAPTRDRMRGAITRYADEQQLAPGSPARMRDRLAAATSRPLSTQARFDRVQREETRRLVSRREAEADRLGSDTVRDSGFLAALNALENDRDPSGQVGVGASSERIALALHMQGLLGPRAGLSGREVRDLAVANWRRELVEAGTPRRRPDGTVVPALRTQMSERQVAQVAALGDDLLDLASQTEGAGRIGRALEAARQLGDASQEQAIAAGLITPTTAAAVAERPSRVVLGGSRWAPTVLARMREEGAAPADIERVRAGAIRPSPELDEARRRLADAESTRADLRERMPDVSSLRHSFRSGLATGRSGERARALGQEGRALAGRAERVQMSAQRLSQSARADVAAMIDRGPEAVARYAQLGRDLGATEARLARPRAGRYAAPNTPAGLKRTATSLRRRAEEIDAGLAPVIERFGRERKAQLEKEKINRPQVGQIRNRHVDTRATGERGADKQRLNDAYVFNQPDNDLRTWRYPDPSRSKKPGGGKPYRADKTVREIGLDAVEVIRRAGEDDLRAASPDELAALRGLDEAGRLRNEAERIERALADATAARDRDEISLAPEERGAAMRRLGEVARENPRRAVDMRSRRFARALSSAPPRSAGARAQTPEGRARMKRYFVPEAGMAGERRLLREGTIRDAARLDRQSAKARDARARAEVFAASVAERTQKIDAAARAELHRVQGGLDAQERALGRASGATPAKLDAATRARDRYAKMARRLEAENLGFTRPGAPELAAPGIYLRHRPVDPMRVGGSQDAPGRGMSGPPRPQRSHGTLLARGGFEMNPGLLAHQAERSANAKVGPISAEALGELVDLAAFRGPDGLATSGPRAAQLARTDPGRVVLVNVGSLRAALAGLDDLPDGKFLEADDARVFSGARDGTAPGAPSEGWLNPIPEGAIGSDYVAISKAAAEVWRDTMRQGGLIGRYDTALDYWKGGLLALSPRWYCVPDTAEALTREGWKLVDALSLDDELLTYGVDEDEFRFERPTSIDTFPFEGELQVIAGRFAATDDHRWPVMSQSQRAHKGKRKVKRGYELVRGDHLVRSASSHRFPEHSRLTPRDAAILGWIVTTGTMARRPGNGIAGKIFQSPRKHLDEIVTLLGDEAGAQNVDNREGRGGCVAVTVRASALKRIEAARDDLAGTVTRLDRLGAEAMWDAMMKAEGYAAPSGGRGFAQNHGAVFDAFQALSLLLGMSVNRGGGSNHFIRGSNGGRVTGRSSRVNRITRRPYSGRIWCPTTPSGTWVMRQDGHVVVTGNTNSFLGVAQQYLLLTGGDFRSIRDANRQGPLRAAIPAEVAQNTLAEDAAGGRSQLGDDRFARAARVGFRANNAMEGVWRRSAFLNRAQRSYRAEGVDVGDMDDATLARAIEEMPEPMMREVMGEMELFMGEYRRFSRFERNVLKRVIPFYSFLRVLGRLTFKMPIRSPIRAEAMALLAEMGTAAINPEDELRESYRRGAIPLPGGLRLQTTGMSTAAAALGFPEALGAGTPGDVAGALSGELAVWASPAIQAPVASVTGIQPFGQRGAFAPAGHAGSSAQFGRAPERINPVTGMPAEYRPRIPVSEAIAQAAVPFLASPVRRALTGTDTVYDTASTLDLARYRAGEGPPRREVIYDRRTPRVDTVLGRGVPGLFGLPVFREDRAALRASYARALLERRRGESQTRRRIARELARSGG